MNKKLEIILIIALSVVLILFTVYLVKSGYVNEAMMNRLMMSGS